MGMESKVTEFCHCSRPAGLEISFLCIAPAMINLHGALFKSEKFASRYHKASPCRACPLEALA